ncbi:zinc finger protein RFP-like isoform X3 [Pogona vitticeps]
MVEESPVRQLCDETTCPICLEYFKDPVTIDCRHNFCQAYITQCWQEPGREASCPQCRVPCPQRDFKPNRQLASIVEIAKKFRLQRTRGAEALGKVCERHQEPLKLFCEDDQALICVVCDKSKEHKEHKVIPKDEAFRERKEEAEIETQKIMAEFNQLHTFLEEQECLVLTKRKNLSDEIKHMRNKNIEKLSKEISSMGNLIKEMEEKHNQPASEFLQKLCCLDFKKIKFMTFKGS